MLAGAAIHGNPHAIEFAPLLIVSGVVNFFVYATLVYMVLHFFKRNGNDNQG
jgi:hypothetical protein